jgi:hypothetical protein
MTPRILLSDISGIVFDHAFLTERPVLTIDFTVDKRGFEALDLRSNFGRWSASKKSAGGSPPMASATPCARRSPVVTVRWRSHDCATLTSSVSAVQRARR